MVGDDFLDFNVSIHASVKDATCCYETGDLTGAVSIHASVKDATLHWCHVAG